MVSPSARRSASVANQIVPQSAAKQAQEAAGFHQLGRPPQCRLVERSSAAGPVGRSFARVQLPRRTSKGSCRLWRPRAHSHDERRRPGRALLQVARALEQPYEQAILRSREQYRWRSINYQQQGFHPLLGFDAGYGGSSERGRRRVLSSALDYIKPSKARLARANRRGVNSRANAFAAHELA